MQTKAFHGSFETTAAAPEPMKAISRSEAELALICSMQGAGFRDRYVAFAGADFQKLELTAYGGFAFVRGVNGRSKKGQKMCSQ